MKSEMQRQTGEGGLSIATQGLGIARWGDRKLEKDILELNL